MHLLPELLCYLGHNFFPWRFGVTNEQGCQGNVFLSHSQLGGQISNSQPEWPQTGIARVHDAHAISGKDQLNFQNSGTSVDWFNFLDGKVIYFLFISNSLCVRSTKTLSLNFSPLSVLRNQ